MKRSVPMNSYRLNKGDAIIIGAAASHDIYLYAGD